MRRIYIEFLFMLSLFMVASCVNELDNYDEPNGGVFGKIVDAETNQPVPLPVQGNIGVIIKMMEQATDATKTLDFYAMHDGSFKNMLVFNSEYLITADGPFVRPGEVRTTVQGQTEVNIPVTPYSRIEASASVAGKVVTIQYKVNKTDVSFNTTEVYGYWNLAPGVDNAGANQAGKVTVTGLTGTITFDLSQAKKYIDNLHKIEANGNKIYLRIGAKTEGAINYSAVIVVTVP